MRSDHHSNNKRGGVCIYYKEVLPLRVINVNYFNECIRFELETDNEKLSSLSL